MDSTKTTLCCFYSLYYFKSRLNLLPILNKGMTRQKKKVPIPQYIDGENKKWNGETHKVRK